MTTEQTLLLWTMIGTAGTALFTLLLALFALLAWRASAKSLGIMRDQEKATAKAAAEQVEDQTWGRQVEALAKYLDLLRRYAMTEPMSKSDVAWLEGSGTRPDETKQRAARDQVQSHGNLERDLQVAGDIWRMLHRSEFKATFPLYRAESAIVKAFPEIPRGRQDHMAWISAAVALVVGVQAWQLSWNKEANAQALLDDVERMLAKGAQPYDRA
ncbi:hypothetical protein [Citricoccus sp. K5]|uniref:hypothetical protein n=1 Tax=Citricoccus sp. K5 TaxID=2653135 RepID=UPI0012F2C7D5|nr:hypothetical protein [Citricoccus sp. K5]VXA92770.1 hypothetical protein CITRIK5_100035 [Citricoccus sp. K5]VXA95293.1 hypothetical protein CITRIK5_100101 [Citricoccus sp. K5]